MYRVELERRAFARVSSHSHCSSEARWRFVRCGDADLQFQLANLLFDETRYQEALQAFDRATQTNDPRWPFGRARARSAPR